jgi:hypothetical protein
LALLGILKTVRLSLFVFVLVSLRPVLAAAPDSGSGNYMLPYCKALVEKRTPGVWEGHCGGIIEALHWIGPSLPEG